MASHYPEVTIGRYAENGDVRIGCEPTENKGGSDMEVLSFRMDLAHVKDGVRPLALLTVSFREGSNDVMLLTEDQVQQITYVVMRAVESGQVASLESLHDRGGQQRGREFLDCRKMLLPPDNASLDIIATDIRPYSHGGAVVVPACKASGRLFLSIFDPFSADALVVAADDCFHEPH